MSKITFTSNELFRYSDLEYRETPVERYMKLKTDKEILGDKHWTEDMKKEFKSLEKWWGKHNG